MKKNLIQGLKQFLICCLLPFLAKAQTASYSCQRKINKPENAKFYSVKLSPELVSQLKSGWNDLRILDFSGSDTVEVPYLLETLNNYESEQKIISFNLINTTHDARYSYLTLKVNDKKVINHIRLDITEPEFDKWIRVEGSHDNKSWFTISERLRIVRFQNSEERFEYTSLDFPNSQYAYFRLKFDNTHSSRLNVSNVYAFETERKEHSYSEVKISNWKQTENKKEKKSELIVDLPVAYRINHIRINASGNKDFYRNINVYQSVTVHTKKGDTEVWHMLNTSVFSSLDSNKISCFDEQTKKLKIEILNNDDQPLEIKDIKAFAEQVRLVAELPASDNLYLLYGKPNDQAPVYDLVHFKTKIPADVPEITYGAEQVYTAVLPAKSPLINSKNWLWGAMSLIMVVIAFFSFRLLKNQSRD